MRLIDALLKKLLENSHRKEVSVGAFYALFIKLLGVFFGFIFTFYVTKLYGADVLGVFRVGLSFVTIGGTLVLLGSNNAILRYSSQLISENSIDKLSGLVLTTTGVSLVISLGIAVAIYAFSGSLAGYFLESYIHGKSVFKVVAYTIPIFAINLFFANALRGLKNIVISQSMQLLIFRVFSVLLLLGLYGYEFESYHLIIYISISLLVSMSIGAIYLFFFFRKSGKIEVSYTLIFKDYYPTSLLMYQAVILGLLFTEAPILILSFFAEPAEIGIYHVAFQLSSLSVFLFNAIGVILAPKFSELYWSNQHLELKNIVRFSSKLTFWTTGSIAFLTIIFSGFLMGIFDREFSQHFGVLIILSVSNLIKALTGHVGFFLDMTNEHKLRRNILSLCSVIFCVIAPIATKQYGMYGLSISILLNMVLGNTIAVYFVWKKFNINTTCFFNNT